MICQKSYSIPLNLRSSFTRAFDYGCYLNKKLMKDLLIIPKNINFFLLNKIINSGPNAAD